jgi:hypothetical protein
MPDPGQCDFLEDGLIGIAVVTEQRATSWRRQEFTGVTFWKFELRVTDVGCRCRCNSGAIDRHAERRRLVLGALADPPVFVRL